MADEAKSKPEEVAPIKALPLGNDRAERVARIVSKISELKGKEAAKTIIEDERGNLESFLSETHKGFESLQDAVKSLLG